MASHGTLGTRSPHTSSGRWPPSHLRPLKLALLFPAVLSLSCARPDQVAPDAWQPPQLIWSPLVAYPPAMFAGRVEGKVILQAMVDSMGRVEPSTIRVVRATAPEFERPAVDMLRSSRFTPGRRGPRTLRSLVSVPVVFDLKRASVVAFADSSEAAALAFQGELLVRQSNITEALRAYRAALRLDSRLNGSLPFWHGLCWQGSLRGHAEDVMFACEQAVALEPLSASTREARGLARAMTSDYEGAIADLAHCAARATTGEERAQRLSWIRALTSGENPFTEEVLQALRQRTT